MITRNAPKFILGVGLTILLLSVSWSVTASRLSKGSSTMLPGIRLVVPVIVCGSDCRSQQVGCENLRLNVCIPSCFLPVLSSASVGGGTAPYTFNVTDPNGVSVSISSQVEKPAGTFGVTFSATKVGPYTTTVTDAKGCRATCSAQPRLDVSVSAVTSLCVSAVLRAAVMGGTAPYTFTVIDPNGNPVATSPTSHDIFTGTSVTFAANKAGRYSVNVTDAIGCSGQSSVAAVTCKTLTQDEWGKNKPKFNGQKRAKTIQRIFRDQVKKLVVGVEGERSITFSPDAATCTMERLPASGVPEALPPGLGDVQINSDTCLTSVPLPLLNDKFQNPLLGQTIALALNAGGVFDHGGLTPDSEDDNDPALWHLVLCGNMVTQGVLPGGDGIFGTDDDIVDANDPKLTVTIPTSVVNAIAAGSTLEALGKFSVRNGLVTVAPGTVGRLQMLANFALAGEPNLGGASIADITAAVASVNKAFDGGRFLVGCSGAGKANLQINFNPNPVPQDTANACGGSFPSWVINTTLRETSGVGVIIDRFTTYTYDTNGNLLFSSSVTGDHFADFFNFCNPHSNHIPAFGQACGLSCQSLGGLGTGSVIMKFEGKDDNGQLVSFISDRLVLRGFEPRANLAISFSPNPASKTNQACGTQRPSWFFTATLIETAGIGINITRFTWDFYDDTGNLLSTQTNSSGDFSAIFTDCGVGSIRIAPGGRACGNQCISFGGVPSSGAVIMTFYGTDDRANPVIFASSRLKLLD